MEKITTERIRWAVVTGATRGIGRSLSLNLARNGYSIFAVARSRELLEQLSTNVRDNGVMFSSLSLDLAEDTAAETLYRSIHPLLNVGEVEVLCLNAAINSSGPFTEIPLAVHERMLAVNSLFNLRFLHFVLPLLKMQKRCSVVLLSSQSAMIPVPWMACYAASKSFVHSLGLALSHELKGSVVRLITAVPAHTDTSAVDSLELSPEERRQIPRGRTPGEIADRVVKAILSGSNGIVTNVPFFGAFRLMLGATPISYLLKQSGKMFSFLSREARFPRGADIP